jgi:hypothetical protein
VLGVVMGIGAAQLPVLMESINRNNSRNEFEYDLARAQNEAASMGTRVVMTPAADGRSYQFGFDNLPYANPPVIEQPIFTRRLPTGITIGASQAVIFDSRGFLVNAEGNYTTTTITFLSGERHRETALIYPTGTIIFN